MSSSMRYSFHMYTSMRLHVRLVHTVCSVYMYNSCIPHASQYQLCVSDHVWALKSGLLIWDPTKWDTGGL